MSRRLLIPISVLLLAAACSPKNFEKIEQLASQTTGAVGCESFESRTWSAIDKYLIEQRELPPAEDIKARIREASKSLTAAGGPLRAQSRTALTEGLEEIIDLLLTEVPAAEKVENSDQLLALLSALELGDQSTEIRAQLQKKVKEKFLKMQAHVEASQVQCQVPDENLPPDAQTGQDIPLVTGTTLPLPVYGLRFAFATAYQTCQALDERVMTLGTASVAGIKVTGKHADGVGNRREIASVGSLLNSHHYYKNVNNYGANCLNPRQSPMIYDYGGKPYATTEVSSTLNFFKNAGSGTGALGIDCSGFVYSALTTAGLRLKAKQNAKATGVYGISASMYVEPEKNGLTCLQKIPVKPNESLQAGDIVAVPGHVLMIDSVGSDPFGLNGVKSINDCQNLKSGNFDFVVAQSSPSKNGIGINRYEGRDYLQESAKMKEALEKYAVYACRARFDGKTYTPNLGTASVIRHKMTPECVGVRVKLDQESCVQSCDQLRN